jgi:hypothetical protein
MLSFYQVLNVLTVLEDALESCRACMYHEDLFNGSMHALSHDLRHVRSTG